MLNAVEQRPTFNDICTALENIYVAMTDVEFEWREEIFGVDEDELDNLEEDQTHPIEEFKHRNIHTSTNIDYSALGRRQEPFHNSWYLKWKLTDVL